MLRSSAAAPLTPGPRARARWSPESPRGGPRVRSAGPLPALRPRDARALIRFLVAAFGFEENVAWGDQPDGSGDVVVHAQLDWPAGGGVMLGSVREGPEDRWPVQPG